MSDMPECYGCGSDIDDGCGVRCDAWCAETFCPECIGTGIDGVTECRECAESHPTPDRGKA